MQSIDVLTRKVVWPSGLTNSLAQKSSPPPRDQNLLWDADGKGFALRVTAGGAKSFVLDCRTEGRQRRITVGAYSDWSVRAARQAAKEFKRETMSVSAWFPFLTAMG